MSVTETRWIELLEGARQTMGRDVAITLMDMLPPSGWGMWPVSASTRSNET